MSRKRALWNSQTDCQYSAPLTGTKLPRNKDLYFNFTILIWNVTRGPPIKTRMDSSKQTEAICVRNAGQESAQFFWAIFPDKKNVLSKTCQWTLQKAAMDSPFCSWTVRSAEKSHFGAKFCSPTDDFGGSKMRGYCLGRIPVGVPVFALGICVSTFDWRFLALWAVNNHLNKTPSRTAIKLCARCTLEEGC